MTPAYRPVLTTPHPDQPGPGAQRATPPGLEWSRIGAFKVGPRLLLTPDPDCFY